jgi:hypothetical protein
MNDETKLTNEQLLQAILQMAESGMIFMNFNGMRRRLTISLIKEKGYTSKDIDYLSNLIEAEPSTVKRYLSEAQSELANGIIEVDYRDFNRSGTRV